MPDDLRTRVAKTLHRLYGPSLGAHPDGWDREPGGTREMYLEDADAVIAALEEHQHRETCGGCRGLGGHSPRCHTQPGALWRRLADMAESLGDRIGGNDTTLANRAYDLMVSLRVRGGL